MQLREKDLPELAGWQVLKRARTLVNAGSVVDSAIDSGKGGQYCIKGRVIEGRRRYVCTLIINSLSEAENNCSCADSRKDGKICEHSIAVTLVALASKPSPEAEKVTEPVGYKRLATNSFCRPKFLPVPLFNYELIGARTVFPVHFTQIDKILPDEVNEEIVVAIEKLGFADLSSPTRCELDKPQFLTMLSALKGSVLQCCNEKGSATKWPATRISSMPARIPLLLSEIPGKPDMVKIELAHLKGTTILYDDMHGWILREADRLFMPTNLESLPTRFRPLLDTLFLAFPETAYQEIEISWLRQEIENFANVFHMECSAELNELLKALPESPEINIQIEGSLRHLDLILTFTYKAGEQFSPAFVSSAFKLLQVDNWHQMPCRDIRNSERFAGKLAGEGAILDFYAGSLERIINSGEWGITIGPRFLEVTKDIEKVRPRVFPTGQESDWLSFNLKFESSCGYSVPEKEIRRLLATGSSRAALPGGGFAAFDRNEFDGLFNAFSDAESEQDIDDTSGIGTRSMHRVFFETYIGDQFLSENHPVLHRPCVAPAHSFKGELRPYQEKGLDWLYSRSSGGFGAILADEMGLGKTVQILALISLIQSDSQTNGPNSNHLSNETACMILCPTSLIHNWLEEIGRFLPSMRTLALHGADRSKRFSEITQSDIVITSYGTLTRDLSLYASISFRLVVADEASCLKNHRSKVAKSVSQVKARSRIALSGTPLENSVQDLWSIMDFANPGRLESRSTFLSRYTNASQTEMQRLRQKISPFILRRIKAEVAGELPSKIERVIYCELTQQQREYYEQLVQFGHNSFKNMHKSLSDREQRMKMLKLLLRMRQVCCDSRLIGISQDKASTSLNDQEGGTLLKDHGSLSTSAKLTALAILLRELLAAGSNVLIFSQFVSMLKLIREHLDEMGLKYCYLDGSLTPEQRNQQVSSFQSLKSEIPIFLMSLKAGGYGLTLTKADTVIHFDPWWNPAVEAQATDRAHRIGQCRTVTSYKLIVEGSVEQKILQLQERKRRIADVMLDEESPLMDTLNGEDIEFILS